MDDKERFAKRAMRHIRKSHPHARLKAIFDFNPCRWQIVRPCSKRYGRGITDESEPVFDLGPVCATSDDAWIECLRVLQGERT